MFFFCFFRTFTPIFHFKLCSFCWREHKNASCPRAQETLATPLNCCIMWIIPSFFFLFSASVYDAFMKTILSNYINWCAWWWCYPNPFRGIGARRNSAEIQLMWVDSLLLMFNCDEKQLTRLSSQCSHLTAS